MSDRIEQIARAIDPAAFEEWTHAPRGVEGMKQSMIDLAQSNMQNRARKQARAAYLATLRSIREPGKEQVAAGYAKDCGNQICSYRGMIDHLIAEANNGD